MPKTGRYVWDGKTWIHASECKKQKIDVAVGSAGYPFWSDALGVHPDQVEQEMADYRKCGSYTTLNERGQVLIENRAHHKEVMKLNKMHERSQSRFSGRVCA